MTIIPNHSSLCENAKEDVCNCRCGGKFHGIAKRSKEEISKIIEENKELYINKFVNYTRLKSDDKVVTIDRWI